MKKKAKETIIVWGAGGHARVVGDVLRSSGLEIAGFIDDQDPARDGEPFSGARVFASLGAFRPGGSRKVLIGIGDNFVREKKAGEAEAKGFRLTVAVHPRAVVAPDVQLGPGTVVMAGAVINAGTIIGRNAIINTLAGIDHDCILGDGVHVSPGVRIGGNVILDRMAWIGIGATVIDHRTVGESAIVGAGAVVVKDVPARVVVAGVPARIIRKQSR